TSGWPPRATRRAAARTPARPRPAAGPRGSGPAPRGRDRTPRRSRGPRALRHLAGLPAGLPRLPRARPLRNPRFPA
ncbi:MAG: hypothetical protein FJ296_10305, partial [Planctomycetes bacterium]|nr:hypothetical protein [Planctomycetota bacterium]